MVPSEQVAAAVPLAQSVNCGVIPLVSGLSVTETLLAGAGGVAVDAGVAVEVGQGFGVPPLTGVLGGGLGDGHRLASQTSML